MNDATDENTGGLLVMRMLDYKGARLSACFCSFSDINPGGRTPDYIKGLSGAGAPLVSIYRIHSLGE